MPLHLAASGDHTAAMERLIAECGIDINAPEARCRYEEDEDEEEGNVSPICAKNNVSPSHLMSS